MEQATAFEVKPEINTGKYKIATLSGMKYARRNSDKRRPRLIINVYIDSNGGSK